MDFPRSKFPYKSLTTKNFFENIYRIINVKVHLHHSHRTGKIYLYVHDFCNWRVGENQMGFSCFAHMFGFSFYFLLKGIRLSVWQTKDINIGGSHLSKINFANIGSQVKFTDIPKYYQISLRQLASTLTDEEKKLLENLLYSL